MHQSVCVLRRAVTRRRSPPRAMRAAHLQWRLRTFGMGGELVVRCATVGDLQAMAKPYYHAALRASHPDHARRHRPRRTLTRFLRVRKVWDWLMRLDGTRRIQVKPALPALMQEREYPDVGTGWHVEYL